MSFINELGKKITQVGQDAVQGTKDMADASRLNSQIQNEQRRVRDMYTQIGERSYELYADSPPEALTGLFAIVRESIDHITQYRDELEKIKGLKKCPSCGAAVPFEAVYCLKCGYDMKNESAIPVETACPNCGNNLDADSAFCAACGYKIVG